MGTGRRGNTLGRVRKYLVHTGSSVQPSTKVLPKWPWLQLLQEASGLGLPPAPGGAADPARGEVARSTYRLRVELGGELCLQGVEDTGMREAKTWSGSLLFPTPPWPVWTVVVARLEPQEARGAFL